MGRERIEDTMMIQVEVRQNALFHEVYNNDLEKVKSELKHEVKYGALITTRMLEYACRNPDRLMVLKELLSSKKLTPEIINARDHNGYGPLSLAVAFDNLNAVKELLGKGAKITYVETDRAFSRKTSEENTISGKRSAEDIENLLWETQEVREKALGEAITTHSLEGVKRCIRDGANVNRICVTFNQDKISPLRYALLTDDVNLMSILIEAGAYVKKGSKELNFAQSKKAADLLLSKGADVNEGIVDGETCLYNAVKNQRVGVVEALSTRDGIEINKGNGKETPLLNAVLGGNTDVVKALLKNKMAKIDQEVIGYALGAKENKAENAEQICKSLAEELKQRAKDFEASRKEATSLLGKLVLKVNDLGFKRETNLDKVKKSFVEKVKNDAKVEKDAGDRGK